MMRKFMIIAAACLLLCGCGGKKPVENLSVVGEWELTSVSTKSAKVGNTTVNVYISFTESGTFELYQMIGEGRYTAFDGTYTLTENILTGKYSNGNSWGSVYEVSKNGENLVLSVQGGIEIDTYKKSSIPDSVKNNTY